MSALLLFAIFDEEYPPHHQRGSHRAQAVPVLREPLPPRALGPLRVELALRLANGELVGDEFGSHISAKLYLDSKVIHRAKNLLSETCHTTRR